MKIVKVSRSLTNSSEKSEIPSLLAQVKITELNSDGGFGKGVDLKTQVSLQQSCTITNTGLAKIVKTLRLFIIAPELCSTENSKIRKVENKSLKNLKNLEYLERKSFPSNQS